MKRSLLVLFLLSLTGCDFDGWDKRIFEDNIAKCEERQVLGRNCIVCGLAPSFNGITCDWEKK